MRKKWVICLVLLALLAPLSLMAGGSQEGGAAAAGSQKVNPAGVLPIVNEKITLTVLSNQDPLVVDFDENSQTIWMEEQTNINVEWQLIPAQQAAEKINLILAAGSDLPDVFLSGLANDLLIKYGEEDVFVDQSPLIEEYGFEIKRAVDDFMSQGVDFLGLYRAPNSAVYALPVLNSCKWCETIFRCWVDTNWLEAVGMDLPDTVDEFYDMLVAFKTKDPNGNGIADEIPLMGAAQGWGTQVEGFLMMPFIVYDAGTSATRLILENGKVSAAYTQKGWLDGVTFIKKLITDGLLDPVSLTQQNQEYKVMGEHEPPIVGTFLESNFQHLTLKDDKYKNYEAIAPLQGVNSGKKQTYQNVYQPFGGGTFAISSECEYPAAAFRWADFQYSEKNSLWSRYGEEGIDWIPATADQRGPFGAPAVFQEIGQWGAPTSRSNRQKLMYLSSQLLSGLAMADNSDSFYVLRTPKYMDVAIGNGVPRVFMLPAEVDEYSELRTTLDTYVDETFARFVTGDLPLSEWDNFQAEVKKIGVDRFIELTQIAYDRQFK